MLSIGEVAEKLDLTVSTLRYWDERGLVRAATRKSGVRYYGEDELHRLTVVKMLRGTGLLSLDDIDLLLGGPDRGDWRAAVKARQAAIAEQQATLAVAETFLGHFLRCPRDHPIETCSSLRKFTNRMLTADR